MPEHRCCETWEAAHQWSTDNEMYGPLIWPPERTESGKYEMGTDLPPIRFCPWCGVEVKSDA